MKNVIILFFVLFTTVAGFANEGECNNGFSVKEVCVEAEFHGGDLSIVQSRHDVTVIAENNEGNLGSVTVINGGGEVVFFESFENNAVIVVNKTTLGIGEYMLVAKAGSTGEGVSFRVE